MAENYNEDDLIRGINENMSFVKNIPIEAADKCAGSIRSALEYAVKLFWLKKYDKKPVWVKGYIESFDLYKAISDERFSQNFSKMTLSYMHTIRQTCNGVLHDNDPLTLDEAKDLLAMLEKCVKAIETAIPMEILVSPIKELGVIETVTTDTGENLIETTEGNPTQPKDVDARSTIEIEKSLDDFKNYLIRCGYTEYTPSGYPSTVYDYVSRIKKVLEWESMPLSELNQNIDRICHEYDIGGTKQDLGEISHRSVINALKRYREYLSIPTYSNIHSPVTKKPYGSDTEQDKQTYGGTKTMTPIIGNSLRRDMENGFGGSAQPIYDVCCERFGWPRSQRHLFGRQQLLYAEGATPEGYSPWFLAHSNLSETMGGKWSNRISFNTIEETWKERQYDLYHDETIRVTFAKTKSFGYVFLGVYKPIKVDEKILSDGSKVWVKTYQRISDTYPQ